jgi:hypothetical protein
MQLGAPGGGYGDQSTQYAHKQVHYGGTTAYNGQSVEHYPTQNSSGYATMQEQQQQQHGYPGYQYEDPYSSELCVDFSLIYESQCRQPINNNRPINYSNMTRTDGQVGSNNGGRIPQ